ncbi:MAG TPA: formyltetrahydrofolate deformylase [Kofleriaceae bacterium]
MTAPTRATFLFAARDQPGLVARLAGFFYELALNIVDGSDHVEAGDADTARFFIRMVVELDDGRLARDTVEAAFGTLASKLDGTWSVSYSDRAARVAILVTKESACLYDLILRQRQGELACEIPLVIGNHATLESVARGFGIPFFALPITADTKRAQEARMLELLASHEIDLVVLARYMQVLTDDFLRASPPVINIHHGFLPAFQGARPYHQARERGVKIIGATAHYATGELDEGPIIEQDVARVSHQMSVDEFTRVGRDIERNVLSRAVRAHLERRVVVHGRRTIVL